MTSTEMMPIEPEQQAHAEWAREEVIRRRRLAYADPLSGSDVMFAEAARMESMGEPGWSDVRERAIARYEEIKNSMPL